MTQGCRVTKACVGLAPPQQFTETLWSVSLWPWELQYLFQKHRWGLDAYKYWAAALQWFRMLLSPSWLCSPSHRLQFPVSEQSRSGTCHGTVSREDKRCKIQTFPLFPPFELKNCRHSCAYFSSNSSLIAKWFFSLQICFSYRTPLTFNSFNF